MNIEKIEAKYPLKNNGELEIVFLGVGSAFALKNHQTNFLIVKKNTHILVDFGMSGPKALEAIGLKAADIDTILPTHSHADHVGGLECLALTNRYVGRRFMGKEKIKMIISEEYQRILWDYSLRGGLEHNEELEGRKLSIVDYFDIVRLQWKDHQPRETFQINFKGIDLEVFRTSHVPETSHTWEDSFISYGLFIDKKVFVSGDTKFDPELIAIYKDAETMFHDVQFFPGAVHAPLENLRTLDESLKAKMHLMHYGDDFDKQNIEDFAGWTQQGVRYFF